MPHLIRGRDQLAKFPTFRLIGRDADLRQMSAILTRSRSNSLLLVGPGGVGCTAVCLGLQALKDSPDAPFDIASKRFFWLDVDRLFADGAEVQEKFNRTMATLWRTPDSVLVIENTREFIEASRSSGHGHFVNALLNAVKHDKTQVIFEVRDEDLEHVLRWHGDIAETCTLHDLKEPAGDDLRAIVGDVVVDLTRHHGGIAVAPDAIDAAIEVTNKYRNAGGITRAQPDRAIILIDRALAAYRLDAHRRPPGSEELEARIAATEDPAERAALSADLAALASRWEATQREIRAALAETRDAETAVSEFEDKLVQQQQREEQLRGSGNATMALSGMESPEVSGIRSRIAQYTALIKQHRGRYEALTAEINRTLAMKRHDVLREFSSISGVPMKKLGEDEMATLRGLEASLNKRIFGQADATRRVANAIKVARVDGSGDGPAASFLLLGPSGTGKTEMAKALAANLMGDAKALVRFDMSEYMERHAVAKLIGAPPGYEGFEAGGILTNSVRRNPVGVYLFDEIEKAHPDVFNVFLQILSDGRLTDNIGREVSFQDIIIVMTSNIGQSAFLDPLLSFEDAMIEAGRELESTYRGEFLNRFNGRQNIIWFNRLGLDSIRRIFVREITDLNARYAERNITVSISEADIDRFCEGTYDPKVGARGLPGHIRSSVQPVIVDYVLSGGKGAAFTILYDAEGACLRVVRNGAPIGVSHAA